MAQISQPQVGPLHPLQAPWFAWYMLNDKKQALRLWLKLLKPPMMSPWYRVDHLPWCGWSDFWDARPWSHS
jgi:hypothetical protein